METTIKFNSEVEGDKYKLKVYQQSEDMYETLIDLKQYLRTSLKNKEGGSIRYEELNTLFYDIILSNGVNLDID